MEKFCIVDGVPLPFASNAAIDVKANPKKYPQGYFKTKQCRRKECNNMFKPLAPSHHYCSRNCAMIAASESYINWNYQITLEEYIKIYKEQNGVCAICGKYGFGLQNNVKVNIVIDHDHLTGEVRGLLCPNCNRALGLFKDSVDSLKKAIEYLQKPHLKSTFVAQPRGIGNNTPLSKEVVFQIYDDIFINKLRCKEIEKKYNISRNTKANIEKGKSYFDFLQEYRERATTIPKGSRA